MGKICIFGAGAVGGYMAAHLAHAGLDVCVVARGAHLDAIRARGLKLLSNDGDITASVRASSDSRELGPQDLVITTVKAHALPQIAAALPPLLRDDTPVVFAVNGIPWWYLHGAALAGASELPRLDPDGQLRRTIGPERAIGCVIRSPNEIVAPGVVRSNESSNTFVLGEPDNRLSQRLLAAADLLRRGLPGVSTTPDIRAEIWRKLMINLPSSTVTALTQSLTGDVLQNPETEAIYRQVLEEGHRVAAGLGVPLGIDFDTLIDSLRGLPHPPSMLQDLVAGRPLEIDAQIGAVQDLARRAGVPTPMLDTLATLLRQRARATYRPGGQRPAA